ncbi:hypothetical protein [Streptosporangium roseum]
MRSGAVDRDADILGKGTVAGWDTVSDSANPRKPVVGASEARRRT